MGMLKKAVCTLLAGTLVCMGCVPALAQTKQSAQKYREEALTVPAGLSVGFDSQLDLSAHGDGLDLFLEDETIDGKPVYSHYRSADGGKSWKEQDTGWLMEARRKMSETGDILQGNVQMAAGKDGAVYALFDVGGQVDRPGISYNYYNGKLIRRRDGATQELLALKDTNFNHYRALGETLGSGTKLALFASCQGPDIDNYTGGKTADAVMVYDLATGKQVSKANTGTTDGLLFSPFLYQNGTLYTWDDGKIAVKDAATYQLRQSLTLPGDVYSKAFTGDYACGPDGAFYELTKSGLYRLGQGSDSWEQVLDGSVCKLGTFGSAETICEKLVVEEDGSIVILLRHQDRDDLRGAIKGLTLHRYVPVQ